MIGVKAWLGHRICRHHAKLNVIKQYVQSGLVLEIRARHTDSCSRFAVSGDQCWRQCNAGALARLDTVRVPCRGVQASEPIALHDSGPGVGLI